jgi:citrate lyase subunit beta/citryl-CoA lyase
MDTVMENKAMVGNKGEDVRSDCHVTLELADRGGIMITLKSRVKTLYGIAIESLVKEILEFFGVKNAIVLIEDTGALPFVIAARMEAAIKKLVKTDKEYLTDFLEENRYQTEKEKNRFSRLYLPGNTPRLMINAGIHKPDGIILDLEDAVAFDKKHEARFVVRNALRSLNFYGAERMVRINQVPMGLEDLDYIIPHNVNLVLVPKCESPDEITKVNERITVIKKEKKIEGDVWLMPIIESAKGVMNVYEIAFAAGNLAALAIGLEDFTADLGTLRTEEGTESFFARAKLVIACKAAGIQAIDSVFSDVGDMEGLKRTILRSKALGFNGMGCIHPRQIVVIHENYAPADAEIEKAKKIYNAFMEAQAKGLGVVSLGTKMIDPPVVKRAQKVIDLAVATGKLSVNWREDL